MMWSVGSTTPPLQWCDQLSVQHLRYNDAISCQYNTSATMMWSVVSTTPPLQCFDQLSVQHTIYTHAAICQYNIHTRLCSFPFSASRFASKVLSWTIRWARKPRFACLFSPPTTRYFSLRYPLSSSLYSHVLSFCSFILRFLYSRILFLSLPLYIICLLEISSIFSVRFISLTRTVFLTSPDCFPYGGQQCCCIATDDSHSSAVFIPAQPPLKRSFLCNRGP